MTDSPQLLSVGHSNHALDKFLSLLRGAALEAVVDIRRYPGSRRHPQFGGESLATALAAEGIEYHWLEDLGGRRSRRRDDPPSQNLGLRHPSFRSYADYMHSEAFRQAAAQLLEIAGRCRAAMMCSEALYWQCHRRLVSDYLLAQGVVVQHLFPSGELRPHRLTPGGVIAGPMVTYPGPPTLFESD